MRRAVWQERATLYRFPLRFGRGSRRMRRVGIVALARRLVIALWRYLELGQVPAGAQLKALPLS